MREMRERGLRIGGMKPIATGSTRTPGGLRNEDALVMMAESNVSAPYELINPYCFEPPISPHLAAAAVEIEISLDVITDAHRYLAQNTDFTIVEGAGGWRVPLCGDQSISDLALRLRLPVILVVGLRLGCINHARLTVEAILADGAPLAGWVANSIDPAYLGASATIRTLEDVLGMPRLAFLPWIPYLDIATIAAALRKSVDTLLAAN
jgi:dethiobiotin synthetase